MSIRRMRSNISSWLLLLAVMLAPLTARAQKKASFWLTTPDKSSLFQLQKSSLHFARSTGTDPAIEVDDKQTFQSIDGFGFALTGGSAQLMMRMSPAKRAALLHELFDTNGNDLGISYLRVSIGSSDMNDRVFSYDDLPAGETDPTLAKFASVPTARM